MATDNAERARDEAIWRLRMYEAQLAITESEHGQALLRQAIEHSKRLIAEIEGRRDDC